MKRGFRHSRPHATAAVLSGVLLISVFLMKSVAGSRNAERLRAEREFEQAAMGRLDALSGSDDRSLAEVRARAARFKVGLGKTETLELVLKCLGDRWVRRSSERSDHGSYSTRTERFAMSSPSPADWPAIVSTVEALERLQGTGVREIDMKSSGAALDQVSIVLVMELAGKS